MATTPEEYLAEVPEAGRPWLEEFWDHVRQRSPGLELTMFRSTPMFKFGSSYLDGYVMFTAAKRHFAAHSLEFELIAETRARIKGAAGGKGNVNVPYTKVEAKPVIKEYVDEVLRRNGLLSG